MSNDPQRPPGSRDRAADAQDAWLDAALEQTFPASDPLPWTQDAPPAPLYLEDFTVGRKFSSATVAVTTDAIKTFAAQFDPQPFHLDEDAARLSPFGRLVASGWHTAAMTMRLLVESRLFIPGGLIGLGGEIGWPRPTYAGDSLHVESEVVEAKRSRGKPDRGIVTITHRTLNQRGEAVQIATLKVLAPSRDV